MCDGRRGSLSLRPLHFPLISIVNEKRKIRRKTNRLFATGQRRNRKPSGHSVRPAACVRVRSRRSKVNWEQWKEDAKRINYIIKYTQILWFACKLSTNFRSSIYLFGLCKPTSVDINRIRFDDWITTLTYISRRRLQRNQPFGLQHPTKKKRKTPKSRCSGRRYFSIRLSHGNSLVSTRRTAKNRCRQMRYTEMHYWTFQWNKGAHVNTITMLIRKTN